MKISIGIVDDHQLFLKSLGMVVDSAPEFSVTLMALNGLDLQEKLRSEEPPDIILLDVRMPEMDGVTTAMWLTKYYPQIKLVALSMNGKDGTVVEMIKAGCCAYLLKTTDPVELKRALQDIYYKGYYNSDVININFRRLIQLEKEEIHLTHEEQLFLELACSDLTYKEIGFQMHVSERRVDGFRENLFHKFNVQSRVGLVLEAIRKNLVNPFG